MLWHSLFPFVFEKNGKQLPSPTDFRFSGRKVGIFVPIVQKLAFRSDFRLTKLLSHGKYWAKAPKRLILLRWTVFFDSIFSFSIKYVSRTTFQRSAQWMD